MKSADNPNNATDQAAFKVVLDPLLGNLSSEAASGDSRRKYASGRAPVKGYEGIYAAAQCSPDLGKQECSGCLEEAVNSIQDCCEGKQGGRILKPSCNLRYEVNSFFGPTTDLTELPPPEPGTAV